MTLLSVPTSSIKLLYTVEKYGEIFSKEGMKGRSILKHFIYFYFCKTQAKEVLQAKSSPRQIVMHEIYLFILYCYILEQ